MCNLYDLYQKLEAIDYNSFYELETGFFLQLSNVPYDKRLPCANAFLTISSWFGTSQRSGVWTFYEAAKPEEIADTVQYLKLQNETELANILEKGIHDYQNPRYAENFDYPEEWIQEADQIDQWISAHEDWLWSWLYNLISSNKDLITAVCGGADEKI